MLLTLSPVRGRGKVLCLVPVQTWHTLPFHILQAEGETEVLVAGDPEHRHMAMCDKQGGMRYHPNAIEILVRF